MKRLSPLVICAIALCAITIAVAYTRATGPLAGRGAGPRQDPVPQPRVFPLDSYLAAGFPIAMANAVVVSQSVPGEKSDRTATAKVTVVNRDANRIDSVSILLFAFQGAARLTRVDSWIRPVNLSPGASAELAFDLGRRRGELRLQ